MCLGVRADPRLSMRNKARSGQPRYIGRHGLKHTVEVREPTRGRIELRYVTDAELAALGLVAP